MRLALALTVVALLVAGCAARGEDPFAYTKKPLYTGGFDLARLTSEGQVDQFRVTDGSIGQIHVQVWINETAGGATIVVQDPSGRTMLTTSEDADQRFALALGEWRVKVTPQEGSAGIVHVLATRN